MEPWFTVITDLRDFTPADEAVRLVFAEGTEYALSKGLERSVRIVKQSVASEVGNIQFNKTARTLVLRQVRINGFRAIRMIQDKAQHAGNGGSFSKAAPTVGALGDAYWVIRVAPFGRAVKRPPTVSPKAPTVGAVNRFMTR